MTEQEVYDKFFIDEEYELENAPTDTYSYRSGWNNALKRASRIVRNEIRSQGDLADEVWELYEKHHSHLATHVLEFGYELKDLLGKYRKGGAE